MSDQNIDDFWHLENICIKDPLIDADGNKALQHFNDTVTFKDNRYHVTWHWRDDVTNELPENFELAMGRLRSLLKHMKQMHELLTKCNETIQDQLEKGIIEKVDTNLQISEKTPKKHYVPHHVIITPSKFTTKIRILYDGSVKTKKDTKSLNRCFLRGPVILEDLCGLLLRFRLDNIALLADLEKAFLQVRLQPSERDVTRFPWLKDPSKLELSGNIQIYLFVRVPFGVISSPFLLGLTVAHHLEKKVNPVAEKIRKNIYVANVITGMKTPVEAYQFYVEAKNIFKEASIYLQEWM